MTYEDWSAEQTGLAIWYRLNDTSPGSVVTNGLEIENSANPGVDRGEYPNPNSTLSGNTGLMIFSAGSDYSVGLNGSVTDYPKIVASSCSHVNSVTGFSIECIIGPRDDDPSATDFNSDSMTFVNRGSVNGFLFVRNDTPNQHIRMYMGGNANRNYTSNLDIWNKANHFLFVYDGTKSSSGDRLIVYINGSKQTNTTASGNIPTTSPSNTSQLYIGLVSGAIMNGAIDEFKIYNIPKDADYALESYQYAAGILPVDEVTNNAILFGCNF